MSRFAGVRSTSRALTARNLGGIAVAKPAGMTRRSLAVRLVLVIAAATSVATSAPQNFVLTDTAERADVRGALHVHVSANERGIRHADDLSVALVLRGAATPLTVTIRSDDPEVPPEQVMILPLQDTGYSADLITQCADDRACDAGLTVEVPSGAAIAVEATASLIAFADSSLFFPDDRSFPTDAEVHVELEP